MTFDTHPSEGCDYVDSLQTLIVSSYKTHELQYCEVS